MSQPIIPVLNSDIAIQYFSAGAYIPFGGSGLYFAASGNNSLYIVQNDDTMTPFFREKLLALQRQLSNLGERGRFIPLFLAGDTLGPDTFLLKEQIPTISDSSSNGVRFVNLSAGSQPMTVTIEGNPPSAIEFNNLAYKTASAWNSYTANSSVPGYYNFTLRDLATGDSLISYTWNYTPFRCNTLVISGSATNPALAPLEIFSINNY